MAKRKQNRQGKPSGAAISPDTSAGPVATSAALLAEAGGIGVIAIFAFMMFLAPALGVPNEEMLQDTLKSIIVSFAALGAALLFFWQQRDRHDPLRWHAVVCLPLLLMVYAVGSIAWAHTYLASVEAIRWFIFSLLVWLGINTLARERLAVLAWGIHGGAVVASMWAMLQFWIGFALFPQGPHPASTFINRNFFAEFAVCTLPFSGLLLAQARQSARVALVAASSALVIVAILMTGTRSALVALWVQLLAVLPFIAWRCREQLAFIKWGRGTRLIAAGMLLGTTVVLGLINTGDPQIAQEGRGLNALERGFKRTGSISPDDSSLGVRMIMWKATAHVIEKRPFSGVGAGSWESEIPLYQADGAQLETDYYVHNEFLQLLAEYGLVGWVFLLALTAYLLTAAWRTLRGSGAEAKAEAPWRAVFLCSLLAFLIVSNVGFPWRMAATGALFALCLAGLAASDARLGVMSSWAAVRLAWRPSLSRGLALLSIACLTLAAYITQQAAECEQKIVRATKIALTISASGSPNHPKWSKAKVEMLELLRQGIAINRHYRKITPIVADELARWGDWKDATWVWESVLSSRPYVVAMLSNAARGYVSMGNTTKAMQYLERAKNIQPHAPAVRSLEVILLSRGGDVARALELARQAMADKVYDYDLLNAAFTLGWRAHDYALASKAMELRIAEWPASRVEGYFQLGNMYATSTNDVERAQVFFKLAISFASEAERQAMLSRIPSAYWARLGFPNGLPQAPAEPQTSANKG